MDLFFFYSYMLEEWCQVYLESYLPNKPIEIVIFYVSIFGTIDANLGAFKFPVVNLTKE